MLQPFPKPSLSPQAAKVFFAIVRYAKQYFKDNKNDRERLPEAASDVMDGWLCNSDPAVKELKRKGIIRSISAGGHSTWELTPYGCEAVSRKPFIPEYCI